MDKDHYLHGLVRKLETSSPLQPEERDHLLRLPLILKHFESGHDIVSEGERTKQCCLVAEGLVFGYSAERQRVFPYLLYVHCPCVR